MKLERNKSSCEAIHKPRDSLFKHNNRDKKEKQVREVEMEYLLQIVTYIITHLAYNLNI